MRIYLVPVEHEEAHRRFVEKAHQNGGFRSGMFLAVTDDEMAAALSMTVVDIPAADEPLEGRVTAYEDSAFWNAVARASVEPHRGPDEEGSTTQPV